MGELDKGGTVTLQELVVSSLAQTDAVAKLLIEKGVITQDEFMEKIKTERATYQEMFQKTDRVGHLKTIIAADYRPPPCAVRFIKKLPEVSSKTTNSYCAVPRPYIPVLKPGLY